jgi:hypothetical protein
MGFEPDLEVDLASRVAHVLPQASQATASGEGLSHAAHLRWPGT